jgi:hypothetical protein
MFSWLRNLFVNKPEEKTPEVVATEQKSVVVDLPKQLDLNNDGKVNLDDAKEAVKKTKNATKQVVQKVTKGRPKKNG